MISEFLKDYLALPEMQFLFKHWPILAVMFLFIFIALWIFTSWDRASRKCIDEAEIRKRRIMEGIWKP